MRVAALPSWVIVCPVRSASETARVATSVDLVAWAAISAIDAAISSTEAAAALTLLEASPTRSFAKPASEDTASAVLLSWLEEASSRPAAARTFASAACTEFSNRAMVWAMVSLRRSRARLISSSLRASSWRSIMASRNTSTVRAITPISSFARVTGIRPDVSPLASRFIAAARPLSGCVMLRPISQLKPSPSTTAMMPTQMMNFLVRLCERIRASDDASTVFCTVSLMRSAAGNICSMSMLMMVTKGSISSTVLPHSFRLAAYSLTPLVSCSFTDEGASRVSTALLNLFNSVVKR